MIKRLATLFICLAALLMLLQPVAGAASGLSCDWCWDPCLIPGLSQCDPEHFGDICYDATDDEDYCDEMYWECYNGVPILTLEDWCWDFCNFAR
jgi:hypothetical protein